MSVEMPLGMRNSYSKQSLSLRELLDENTTSEYLSLSFSHYREATKIRITGIDGSPVVYTAIIPASFNLDPYALQFFPQQVFA